LEPLVERFDGFAPPPVESFGRRGFKIAPAHLAPLAPLLTAAAFAPLFPWLAAWLDLSTQKPAAGPFAVGCPFDRFADVVGVIAAVGQDPFGLWWQLGNFVEESSRLANARCFDVGEQREYDTMFWGGYHHFEAIAVDPSMMLRVTPGSVAIDAARRHAAPALTLVPDGSGRSNEA